MAVRAVKCFFLWQKLQHLQVKILMRDWHDGIFSPKLTLFEDQILIVYTAYKYVSVCYCTINATDKTLPHFLMTK